MTKKKVVFLGSKKIGLECLKILDNNSQKFNYEIIGILTNDRGDDIKKYSTRRGLKLLGSLNEFLSLDKVNIAISVQYHKILKKEHIKKAEDLIVNLHMAPLPEYRGCNQFTYAIINNDKKFGTTIHIVDDRIDSGDILFEKRFPIPENCWVDELYQLTFKKSIELFKGSLKNIIELNINPKKQSLLKQTRGCNIHYRNEIQKLKQIDLNWPEDKIKRHIRATYMPNFEPPYCIINKTKIYFSKDYRN